ncbi:hypothetical protein [Methanobrevibacter sp.]|uniref:hypothetical protein n=1 Tax=Methanobrevibacter sp. TaxID=66852 RepID=UPI0025E7D763|nr:hypothetical protein [Methanobrevibacter sp.]MBQ2831623.1 hypothetical protein [Methanobrevibacter sp.]
MNSKKTFGILFLILVLITSVGVICASQEVDFAGKKFNIPDNYKLKESDTNLDDDGFGYQIYSCSDNIDEDIIININVNTHLGTLNPNPGEVEKTVNGVDGFYDSSKGTFTYADGDYLVSIQAPEQLLEQIVIQKYENSYDGPYQD